MMNRRFAIKLLLLLAICLSGGSVFSFYTLLYEQNQITEPSIILVEKGDTLSGIAVQLKKDGFIQNISVFKAAARLAGKSTQLKAGEYRIPAYASTKMILDILVKGQTVVRRVTIPEGKTSGQIFDLLMQTPGLSGELPQPPENGTLLPETYVFSYGSPRRIITQRMEEGLTRTIDELWPYRDPDLPYTSKHEALTLASIVEKETSLPEERARIAGVFVNRLRKGMKLQTDPTVIYAVTDGSMELNRRLTYADLKKDHQYNTYMRKGLPPGPICNPGRDSILAVLQPLKSDEIYFVADGTGGHVFSKTFDQHKTNIAEAKRNRRRRNVKVQTAAASAKPEVVTMTVTPQEEAETTITTTFADDPSGALIPSEISADIMDDAAAEEMIEKPVDPEVLQKPVPVKNFPTATQEKKQAADSNKPVEKAAPAKAVSTKPENTAQGKENTARNKISNPKKTKTVKKQAVPAKKTTPKKSPAKKVPVAKKVVKP